MAAAAPLDAPPRLRGVSHQGAFFAAAALPAVLRTTGPALLGVIVAGGVCYTAGAIIYALRRPDPWPRIFGYHEVFHALTIVAVALHFAAIVAIARGW